MVYKFNVNDFFVYVYVFWEQRQDHYYRVNYLDKWQRSGSFFIDSYLRDKKEVIQPNLVDDFLLVKGYKYQFFSKIV